MTWCFLSAAILFFYFIQNYATDTGPLTGLGNKTLTHLTWFNYYYAANPAVMSGKLTEIYFNRLYNLKTGNNRQAARYPVHMLIA